MKVAISTDSGSVSAHFGRCPSYTLVDIEDGRVVGRANIPNPGHQPGFLPRFLAEKGVSVIIAGGMGPRAQGLFAENNIRTIIGVQGRIGDVIDKFLRQDLEPGEDLCDHGNAHEGPCRHGESPEPNGGRASLTGLVCVSARGPDLDAEVDPRFGRAAYFLIVDPKTLNFKALANPNALAGQGAGIQSAQLVAAQRVGAVVTGQVGPNAARILETAGIRIVNVDAMTVRDALSRLEGR